MSGSGDAVLAGLPSEGRDPRYRDLDLLPVGEQLALATAGDAQVPLLVAAAAPAVERAVLAVAERLAAGGRLLYQGAGSAGRVAAQDAAEVAPTFGVGPDLVVAVVAGGSTALVDAREGLEDDEDAGRDDLDAAGLSALDALVAVSASGRTPYVLAGARRARELGALTIGLVGNAGTELAGLVDVAIEVPTGPELVAGSTRLRAGTAQKLVLNQISTLVMVRLGHTYGDLMVGVRPDNAKLRDRGLRALVAATGVSEDAAAGALADAGDLRTALVVLLADVSPGDARSLLAVHAGRVRDAVAAAGRGDLPPR